MRWSSIRPFLPLIGVATLIRASLELDGAIELRLALVVVAVVIVLDMLTGDYARDGRGRS